MPAGTRPGRAQWRMSVSTFVLTLVCYTAAQLTKHSRWMLHTSVSPHLSHSCWIKIWENHRFSDSKFRRPIYTGHSVFVKSPNFCEEHYSQAKLSSTSECNYCAPRTSLSSPRHVSCLSYKTSILFPVPSMCLLLCISKCRLMMNPTRMILCNNSSLLWWVNWMSLVGCWI